jgi:hypothetical protein
MEWILLSLLFIFIDLSIIISCLNDIRRDNCGRNHYERIDRIVRKLDEIIDKLDKIEKDRSN